MGGQKVNPNLLRLKSSKEWFLKNILIYYGVFICNCTIYKTNTFVYIYFSYFLNNENRKKISSRSFNNQCFMNFILNILSTFTANKLVFRLICQDTNKYVLNLVELYKLKSYKLRYIFKKLFEFPFKKYKKTLFYYYPSILQLFIVKRFLKKNICNFFIF